MVRILIDLEDSTERKIVQHAESEKRTRKKTIEKIIEDYAKKL